MFCEDARHTVPSPTRGEGTLWHCSARSQTSVCVHAYISASLTLALQSCAPLSLRKWILLFAQRQPDRRAGKLESLAQRVDQIAPVVVRHRIGAAAEQDEGRRPALGLRQ